MKTSFLLRAFAIFCIATLGFTPSANAQLQNSASSTAPSTAAARLLCPLVVTPTANPILCNGGTTTITTLVTGNAGLLSYELGTSGQQSAGTFGNISAGTYTVTVREGVACAATATVIVAAAPDLLTVTASTTSDVTCFGLRNGVGAAVITGGTAPYTYSWDSGSIGNPALNLNAGTHTVTVRDINGCTTSATTTVTSPTKVVPTTSIVNNVTCFGFNNGSANAVGVGGTAPYTYLWDNGQAFTPATNLLIGLHFVTVTDAVGCTGTASTIPITQPSRLVAPIRTVQTISCPTFNDGSIEALPAGGTGPYSFAWSSGEITNPAVLLFVGPLTVTVTDVAGCIAVTNGTMTEPTALSLAFTNTVNVSCFQGTNGKTSINVLGGTPPYTYLWNITPNSGNSPINLPAGTHTVTVTDSRLCVATANVLITEPAILAPIATETSPNSCFGGRNGGASVSVMGGVMPYFYFWSDGLGVQPTTNSCAAGTHTVTITDGNNCTMATTMISTEPTRVNVTAIANTLTSCLGAFDGTATATATGGTGVGTYQYVWDNGDPNATVSTLSGGPHTVTATDANMCASSTVVVVLEPAALVVNASQSAAITCAGLSNGSALAEVFGGTQPYIYSWDGGVSALPEPIGLAVGPHSVIVTDANGCIANSTATITQPAPLDAIATQTQAISCNSLMDGHATVTPSGGIPNYRFVWSNGATTQSITNADNGIITVTVTDANNCPFTTTTFIDEPTPLGATTGSTPNSCFGGNDGTATAAGFGGVPPYSYEWSFGQIITPLATGLPAGTVTVTVTDANGCIFVTTANIAQPTPIQLTIPTQTNILCFSNLTGSATVAATGGTQTIPYTYLWSIGQTTATAIGLARGAYSVIVTDGNGCTQTTGVTILEPLELVARSSNTDIFCNGAQNGAVSVSVTGGTGAGTYLYNWNTPNANLTPQVAGLSSGVYTVTVTDGNGCTRTTQAQVQEPSLLNIGLQVANLQCNGASNGQIIATVSGGTGIPTYLWSDVLAQTTSTATGLSAGIYTVTVTDTNGCVKIASTTISEPTLMVLTMTQTTTKCVGSADGKASVAVNGGSGGYNYNWSTTPAQNGSAANNLIGGIYTVTVIDRLGCIQSAVITVEQPNPLVITMDSTAVRCNGTNTGTVTANVTGGSPLVSNGGYNYSWTGAASAQNAATATNLPNGTYTVIAVDANNCPVSASVSVTTPTAVALTVEARVVKCFGENNGSAIVNTVGGTGFGTYTFAWNIPTNNTDSIATGLVAGTYIVLVTDANSCTASASTVVYQPDELLLSNVAITPVNCRGGSDGAAIVSPQGGNNTTGYTYTWATTPPQLTETASGLLAGTYNVSVTDAKGCSTNTTVIIPEPLTAVSVEMAFTEPRCFGGADGTATVLASGGTTTVARSYEYVWNGGQTNATATGFSAGIYTVIATDINGCSATGRVVLLQPSRITTSFLNTASPSCHDGRDGSSNVFGSGGTPPYASYLWSTVPPRAGTFADGLFGGLTYVVTATDSKGCMGTGTVSIPNPDLLTIAVSTVPANCFGNNSGTASVLAQGGSPVYNYLWSNNNVNATATGLSAGVYAVTVTDFKGCSKTGSITVVQGATLNIRGNATPVRCFGESNGRAVATAVGGAPNYRYAWNNNATINTPSQYDLPQGTYTVTITDNNLCTVSTAIEVTQPSELIANATPTDLRCYRSLDGQIRVDASGGTTPYKYTFNTGLTPSTNATYIGASAGTYKVTVRDVNGCTATTTATINEPQQLKVDAGNDLRIEFGQADLPELTAISNDIAANFVWSATPNDTLLTPLNNGNARIIVNPQSDTYYYVTATDMKGCTASDRVQITVNATRRVFVANAFTPNNDNRNDILFVQGGAGTVKVKSFEVFNRWGELVFASKDTAPNVPAYGWNGIYKDEVVDPAVFIWVAVIEFADGQILTYKGDTTVLK